MHILDINNTGIYGLSDAETIQNAIDAASCGDTVRVPRYNARTKKSEWRIDKAILLKTGITLLLDNCRLVMETGTYDNMFRNETGAADFQIIGEGSAVLSGGEWNYLSNNMSGKYGLPDVSVNTLIKFDRAASFSIKNLRFEMARWTSVMLSFCRDAEVKNLWFQMIPHVKDLYGVILGCGCRNISVSNVTGRTGDDAVYLFADSHRYGTSPENGISGISLRNVCIDPNRASVVHIRANGGNVIKDVSMDCIIDSSDFFDKKRILSNIHIGTEEAELLPQNPKDVNGIRAENVFSAAVNAVAVNGSLSDSLFQNIFTFGDNINIAKGNVDGAKAENVTFRRLWYGKGSEPNNSTSFISRYAYGSRAMELERVAGNMQIEKLIDVNEEDA